MAVRKGMGQVTVGTLNTGRSPICALGRTERWRQPAYATPDQPGPAPYSQAERGSVHTYGCYISTSVVDDYLPR